MAKPGTVVVKILGDDSALRKSLAGASQQVDGFGSKLGKLGGQFADFGKKAALVGGAAAAGLAFAAKGAIDAAEEAQSVQRKVAAVIKSTGGAANVTAKQVDSLAGSMQFKIGVDDEVIKKAATLLLTFKGVRNEAGEGGRIFDRATQAAADLAAAGFGSMDSAAKQLGKALNDPIKGTAALSKAGVTFTQAQKDQIKAMVEAGDTLGAQKLIMAEVESQVGGTAAAGATASQKMKVAFGELQEKVGGLLLPAFQRLTQWVTEKLIPALQDLAERYGPIVKRWLEQVREKVAPVAKALGEKLAGAFQTIGKFARENKEVVAAFIGVLAAGAAIAGIAALGAAIASLFNPVTLIILGIAGLVAGLVWAYKHFKPFREAVQKVAEVAKKAWAALQKAIQSEGVQHAIKQLGTVVEQAKRTIKPAFEAIVAVVRFVVKIWVAEFKVLRNFWDRFGSHIVEHIRTAIDAVAQIFRGVIKVIRGVFDIIAGIFTGDWGRLWKGVKEVFAGVWDAIVGTVRYAVNLVSTIIGAAVAAISTVWGYAWGGIKAALGAVWDAIVAAVRWGIETAKGVVTGTLDTIVGFVTGMKDRIASAAAGMWDGIKHAFKSVLNTIIGWWNGMHLRIPKVHIPGTNIDVGGFDLKTPDIPLLAKGGNITAAGLAVVGERGPELVSLPRGAAVSPLGRGGMTVAPGAVQVSVTVNGGSADGIAAAVSREVERSLRTLVLETRRR